MRLSLQRFISLCTCLLIVSLSLASCGNVNATSSTDSMTLKFVQNTNSATFFTLYVALQENFFKKQGLTLDPTPSPALGNGSKVTAAIESNSFELAAGTITDAFTLSKVDAHIKILGTLINGFSNDIVVSKKFEQQTGLTESSPLVDKVKALVGKTIGISAPGTSTEAMLIYLFKQYGFDARRDATLVNLGGVTSTASLGALNSGRVDAISFPPPVGQVAEAHGVGDIFISPAHGDVPTIQGMPFAVLYAKQSVIDAKPKAVQAFIRAIAQAEAFMHQHPNQTVKLLGTYLHLDPKTTAAFASAWLSSYPSSPRIDQTIYNAASEFHVQVGLIPTPFAYNNLVATATINSALSGLANT